MSQVAEKEPSLIDAALEARLTLAATHLKWTPGRIAAFRDGFCDGRKGNPDARRRDRHTHDDGYLESTLSAPLLDSLGYRDGIEAALAFGRDVVDYSDSLAMMENALAWAANGENNFDIDDASLWRFDATGSVSDFLRIMSQEAWIAWFVSEHEAAIEDGRPGYAYLLLQDIEEAAVYVDYGDRLDVWDGYHRIGASMMKGAERIPVIKALPPEPTQKLTI